MKIIPKISEELKSVLGKKLTEYGVDPESYELIVENTQVSERMAKSCQRNRAEDREDRCSVRKSSSTDQEKFIDREAMRSRPND